MRGLVAEVSKRRTLCAAAGQAREATSRPAPQEPRVPWGRGLFYVCVLARPFAHVLAVRPALCLAPAWPLRHCGSKSQEGGEGRVLRTWLSEGAGLEEGEGGAHVVHCLPARAVGSLPREGFIEVTLVANISGTLAVA